MTVIYSSMIPTISPGNLFTRLADPNSTLNIRWLVAFDPNYFEALNRPIADMAVRQLVIAKAVDQMNLRLNHQAMFPFQIQAKVVSGSDSYGIPVSWVWDCHASLPKKWEDVRLAKIKRISGSNPPGGSGSSAGTDEDYTGTLRLIFTGQEEGATTEVALFYVDYQIDSVLSYQRERVTVVTSAEEPVPIDPGEAETVDGFISFRTLDLTDETVQGFFDFLAPPVGGTDTDSDGHYDTPAVYQIMDSVAGGLLVDDDFSLTAISHGTGILTFSAWNAIPPLDSDVNTWLGTFNYPFDVNAARLSLTPSGITIPQAIFREFDIAVPAGDEPTGDISGTYFPVWVSRIVREDTSAQQLSFYFSTYNVSSVPSTEPIEFARLTLDRDWGSGRVVDIEPIDDLYGMTGTAAPNFQQGFGRGHVVLSSKWGGTGAEIIDFFDAFLPILDDPADATFSEENTRISSFALSRVPKYIPTIGEWEALKSTAARKQTPEYPADGNRFVTEADQGLGDVVDFATSQALPEDKRAHPAIERYGYKGSLLNQKIKLVVDSGQDTFDYNEDILPRLMILLGRMPLFGDEWFDGTAWKRFNGDTWTTP